MIGTADHKPTGNPSHTTESATSHGSIDEDDEGDVDVDRFEKSSARELPGAAMSSNATKKTA